MNDDKNIAHCKHYYGSPLHYLEISGAIAFEASVIKDGADAVAETGESEDAGPDQMSNCKLNIT